MAQQVEYLITTIPLPDGIPDRAALNIATPYHIIRIEFLNRKQARRVQDLLQDHALCYCTVSHVAPIGRQACPPPCAN